MKNLFKTLTLIVALSALSLTVRAQGSLDDPKYGATPEERKENVLALNYFNDAYNNKDYDQAVVYLQQLVTKAPKASQNVYINGSNIYKNKIARARSVAEKDVFIDSLMMLYDLRMEHFGDHATRGRNYILGLKAQEYLAYKPADRAGAQKLLLEAITAGGDETELDVVNYYFNSLVDSYKADELETDALLSEYERMLPFFDKNPSEEATEAKGVFEALFISSGAASCENLEKLFAPKIAANPNDVETLDKAMALLSRNNCVSDFQTHVGELLYKHKPSSNVALSLAAAFEAKKDFNKARTYLNEAIASEADPIMKANLAVRIAGGELQQGNSKGAAEFAKQAIDINPENGYAYMILASAYAAGSTACSDFNRLSVFWLVVDVLRDAKNRLSGDAEQVKTIDSQIASYSANFPTNEECFFRGLDNGQGYTVSCGWISGRTTVRTVR